jgi:hypothetical protein
VVITADEHRRLEPGSLLYPNTDVSGPFAAAGVVFGLAEKGRALALVRGNATEGELYARDAGGLVSVRILHRLD